MRTPKLLFSVVLTLCLTLTACGSSSDDADAGSGSAATTTAEQQDAATTATSVEAAEQEETDETASSYLGSYALNDEEFGTMVTVTVDGTTRTIASNALPDHETGEFPNSGNPNEISAQDVSYEFTTEPTFTGDASFSLTTGVAVNGVKFEPGTGESVTCSSGESVRVEAIDSVHDLGLDFNNAHVQPGGEYHYHGISELLVDAYQTDIDLVHVGFAADSYLMYYSKTGAYDSSYALETSTRSGTDCLVTGPDSTAFDLEGTAPDGSYDTDWVFTDGLGDLDSCNGTTIDGEYAYIVTDTYPYVSRCLNGEVTGGAGPGGGEEPGAAAGGAPDFSDAAAALGVTTEELEAALGMPPDPQAAAATLGITIEELEAVLPAAPTP